MQIKISFHNMEHSAPLEEHTLSKLEKLHELLKAEDYKSPFYVEAWLKSNKKHPHSHMAELHLKTSGLNLHAHDSGADLYVAMDNAIDAMVKLVKKEKEKNRDKSHKAKSEKTDFIEKDEKYTL
jgi:ribosomal subunit interface protein